MTAKIKLEEGKTYITKNGDRVKVVKNRLPYYKFSSDVGSQHHLFSEVWTEDGVAYHDDCGFSFVAEHKE